MTNPEDFKLTPKQARTLNRCLRELFSTKAFDSVDVLRGLDFSETIRRLVSVSEERGFQLPLSDQGISAHDRIVATLQDIGVGRDEALYSDIWSAVRKVAERCFARKQRPDDASEFVSLVWAELLTKIKSRTFVAPLLGVKLVNREEVRLGSLVVVNAVDALLSREGLSEPSINPAWLWKSLREYPCLVGTYRGTFEASKRRFTEQAHLLSGFLAVIAGYMFDRGATSFDIRVLIGTSEASGTSGYLHWCDADSSFGWGGNGGGSQQLEIDDQRATDLTEPGFINYGMWLLQNPARTDVEDAISRAVYWYGDAHRDSVSVMQFVKYWSCIECFFSLGEGDITESLAVGLATVLTFGHLQLFERADYKKNKAAVKKLYAKRSQAVHGAVHVHVNHRDLVQISQWAAFVIANMISFANADLPSRQTLLDRLRLIDSGELQGPAA